MKYKKYILILLITLFIGCNEIYAANKYEKTCYYISSNDDFKATLTIKSGYDSGFWHSVGDYTEVYVDKNGSIVEHNKENLNNWYGGIGTMFETKTSKGNFKFNTYYKNYSQANADSNPACPKYLVFQDCSTYKIWATEDSTLAQNASNAINQEKNCKGYYAISGYSAEDYYGSFADLTPGGTPAETDCDSLFGDKEDEDSIAYLIDSILDYVRIIVPILIILLGSLDFAKAVVAGKEDEMRKAQSTFIKRLIIGVCVFFVPILVDIVMYLADIVWEGLGYSSCNI